MRWRIVILYLLTLVSAANGATRKVQYVDTDAGSDANDGSSWKEAYQSAAGWESQNTNLMAADQYLDVYFRGATADPYNVTITDWTTDATRYIVLHEDPNNYHAGIWDTSCYRIEPTTGYANCLYIQQSYVTVDGLQIRAKKDSPQTFDAILIGGDYSGITVKNCLIQRSWRTNYGGIDFDGGTGINRFAYNNIIWDCDMGIRIYSGANAEVYHNTIAHSRQNGIQIETASGQTMILKNNLIHGSVTKDYYKLYAYSPTTGKNFTSDNTTPDGDECNEITVAFADHDANDFHLAAGENQKYNGFSPGIGGLTADIDGAARNDWDAGADELGAGPYPIWAIIQRFRRQ